jgi:hypothetical protein
LLLITELKKWMRLLQKAAVVFGEKLIFIFARFQAVTNFITF